MEKKGSWEDYSRRYFVLIYCWSLSILPRHMPNRIQHFGIWTTLAQCCIRIDHNLFRCSTAVVGRGFLITEVSRPHSVGLSGRVIVPWRTPVPDKQQHLQDRHLCARRDSNQQSQRESGRRPPSQIVRPPKSAGYKTSKFFYPAGFCCWLIPFL
jgi:hypothetical protein